MRINYTAITPSEALPLFILTHLPPFAGGVVFATLVLATVATGAGLILAISTILNRDVIQLLKPGITDKQALLLFRFLIVLICATVFIVTTNSAPNAVILNWSYLSLGLRGSAICFPLLAIIFLKGKISSRYGAMAILCGPMSVVLFHYLPVKLNSLYPGLAISFCFLVVGYRSALSDRKKLSSVI